MPHIGLPCVSIKKESNPFECIEKLNEYSFILGCVTNALAVTGVNHNARL